jgi:hypothetical protein
LGRKALACACTQGVRAAGATRGEQMGGGLGGWRATYLFAPQVLRREGWKAHRDEGEVVEMIGR